MEPSNAVRDRPPRQPQSWRFRAFLVLLVSGVLVVTLVCLAARFTNFFKPPAERYLSKVRIRDYQLSAIYAEGRDVPAEIAVFTGPPADDILKRLTTPGVVVRPPAVTDDFVDEELLGEGIWQGCRLKVWRTKTEPQVIRLGHIYHLSQQQRQKVETGQLSAVTVTIVCGSG